MNFLTWPQVGSLYLNSADMFSLMRVKRETALAICDLR